MAGETTTATPPAASGGISKEDVKAIIADSLKSVTDTIGELAKNQKVLADTFAQSAAEKPEKKDEARPLTAADVTKLVTDALAQQGQQQQQSAARAKFASENLGKLPAVYQQQLGSDPAKWADEAKAIQGQFEKDLAASGVKLESLGGASKDGGTTAAKEKPDLSKLPASERILIGLESLPVPTEASKPAAK